MGRRRSGGEFRIALFEIVLPSIYGEERAGTRPAPTGSFGGVQSPWVRRERAGTRPAPTGSLGGSQPPWVGAGGQTRGLPLLDLLGECSLLGWAQEGRHEACPYWISWGSAASLGGRRRAGTRPAPTGSLGGVQPPWVGAGGQARGLPLRDLLGDRSHLGWAGRAGTRPAPTGSLGGSQPPWVGAGGQARGLPLRDLLGDRSHLGWAQEGRHEACPYGIFWGIAATLGGRRRAGTRPAPTGSFGGLQPPWVGAGGQARGLPLRG